MDTELFELCKGVYERFPNWYGDDNRYSFTDRFSNGDYELMQGRNGTSIPLYTSDFLLDKIGKFGVKLWTEIDIIGLEGWWSTIKGDDGLFLQNSDTPLKTLLKLVIALDNAGAKL